MVGFWSLSGLVSTVALEGIGKESPGCCRTCNKNAGFDVEQEHRKQKYTNRGGEDSQGLALEAKGDRLVVCRDSSKFSAVKFDGQLVEIFERRERTRAHHYSTSEELKQRKLLPGGTAVASVNARG